MALSTKYYSLPCVLTSMGPNTCYLAGKVSCEVTLWLLVSFQAHRDLNSRLARTRNAVNLHISLKWLFIELAKTFHRRAFAKKFKEFDREMAKVINDQNKVFGDETYITQLNQFSDWTWDIKFGKWDQFSIWMCVTKIRWIVIGEWVACQIYIIWIFEECHSMKNQFSEMRPLPTCCLHFLLPFRNVMIWNWLLKDFVWVITMYSWLTSCTVSIFNSKWFYRMWCHIWEQLCRLQLLLP